MTMAQKNMIHHCVGNHAYFRNWSCKTMNNVWIATWHTRSASESYKALPFGHKLFFADIGKWLVIDQHLPIILCPAFALWTPLNTLIHPSGRNQTLSRSCKGMLDSWNCNFRIRSNILRHRCFYCRKKKEVGFSFHWRMTCSQTAYFNSEQSLLPTSLPQNSCSCWTFIFWRERRCSLPRLFRSLKSPLPLKRPVLKFPNMDSDDGMNANVLGHLWLTLYLCKKRVIRWQRLDP